MVQKAFTVLTEFKFEVGAALVNTNAVASNVEKISAAATGAQFALARLSTSFVGGLFGGSFLGAMVTASRVADDFANAQIALANTLIQTGMSFEERMSGAAGIMERLNDLAVENSLNFKELVDTTKLLTPMLLNKGLAGNNLGNVTELSRTFLKSAPTLGINPQDALGQLLRTMEGQASMGDTLFMRLGSETEAMREFLNNTKKWNSLQPHKRLEVLTKALRQFSDDTDAVSARVKTLSGQMAVLQNNVVNLLRPIGQMLNNFLSAAIQRINSGAVMGKAKTVFDNLAKIMENFLVTPERMYADLEQMSKLRANVGTAGTVVGILGITEGLAWGFQFLGVKIPVVSAAVAFLGHMVAALSAPIVRTAVQVGGFMGFLETLASLLSRVFAPLVLIIGALQFLARATAYAKLSALEGIARQMPRITQAMTQFSGIFSVLMDGFDLLAGAFGRFLDPTRFLGFIDLVDLFASVLEFLAGWLGRAMMGFMGLTLWLMEFVNQIGRLITLQGFDPRAMDEAGNFGMEEMYKRIFGKIEAGEGALVNQTVNMDVKMQNNFKEMLEPDRVAFTIKDQLLKAARNKTQAAGRGFEAAGASAGR